MPKFSIVIINDNAEEYCKVFFQSLQSQKYDREAIEVIFIDNCSQDQSVAVARKYDPDLLYKFETRVSHRPFLYTKGIELSTSDYILFVHSDVYFETDFLSKFGLILDQHEYDFINFKLKSSDFNDHGYDQLCFNLKIENLSYRRVYQGGFSLPGRIDCSESCFAIKRDLLLIEGFDAEFTDSFFEYIPLLRDKIKVHYENDITIIHYFIEQHDKIKTEESDKAVLLKKYRNKIMQKVLQNEFPRNKSGSIQIIDRDKKQSAAINSVLSEYDKQIANFKEIVAECDEQISTLSQAVVECDAQLTTINQVAAGPAEIADLKKVAEKRAEQIANLKKSLAKRDEQISNLKKAAKKREEQISNFRKALVKRDEQIAGFSHHLVEHNSELHKIQNELHGVYNSKKWKAIMVVAWPVLFVKSIPGKMLTAIMGFMERLKRDIFVLNKTFNYIKKNGIKELILTIRYKAKRRQPTIKLNSSIYVPLHNLLNRLGIAIKSEQVIAAFINMFGRPKTKRIMENIVNVERFISDQNNRRGYPIIYTSRLPDPLPKPRARNILFVTAEFPDCHHGGGNRVLNFIKALSADNNIYLCTAFFPEKHKRFFPNISSYCRKILKIPYDRFCGNQDEIREWLGTTNIDIVHYEWPRSLENYAADFGKIQIFTFMEAVSWRLLMDIKRLTPLSTTWLEKFEELAYMLWLEFVQAAKVDARIAVTENDARFFSKLFPFQKYAVLNHGLDFDEFALPDVDAEPHTLTFVGNYMHYPNAEAMEFFFDEIWGNVRKAIPDVRIYVVGTNPDNNLRRKADGKKIIVTGTVADVRPYIQKASVCIAPLISGTGLRGKVIEYAALHRPFVATSIASAGLVFKNGVDYFCADTASEFSDKIITLLKDPHLARRMAKNAYVTARQNYDNQQLAKFLLSFYERLERSDA